MATFSAELVNFSTAYKKVMTDSMAADGIFAASIAKITEQFDTMGIPASKKAELIANVAAQMATNIATSAQSTAVSLAMSPFNASLLEAQTSDVAAGTIIKDAQSAQDLLNKASQKTLTDNQGADVAAGTIIKNAQSVQDLLNKGAQKLLVERQTVGFDDKRNVDKAKVLGDTVGLTSTATGTIDAGLLTALNTAITAI